MPRQQRAASKVAAQKPMKKVLPKKVDLALNEVESLEDFFAGDAECKNDAEECKKNSKSACKIVVPRLQLPVRKGKKNKNSSAVVLKHKERTSKTTNKKSNTGQQTPREDSETVNKITEKIEGTTATSFADVEMEATSINTSLPQEPAATILLNNETSQVQADSNITELIKKESRESNILGNADFDMESLVADLESQNIEPCTSPIGVIHLNLSKKSIVDCSTGLAAPKTSSSSSSVVVNIVASPGRANDLESKGDSQDLIPASTWSEIVQELPLDASRQIAAEVNKQVSRSSSIIILTSDDDKEQAGNKSINVPVPHAAGQDCRCLDIETTCTAKAAVPDPPKKTVPMKRRALKKSANNDIAPDASTDLPAKRKRVNNKVTKCADDKDQMLGEELPMNLKKKIVKKIASSFSTSTSSAANDTATTIDPLAGASVEPLTFYADATPSLMDPSTTPATHVTTSEASQFVFQKNSNSNSAAGASSSSSSSTNNEKSSSSTEKDNTQASDNTQRAQQDETENRRNVFTDRRKADDPTVQAGADDPSDAIRVDGSSLNCIWEIPKNYKGWSCYLITILNVDLSPAEVLQVIMNSVAANGHSVMQILVRAENNRSGEGQHSHAAIHVKSRLRFPHIKEHVDATIGTKQNKAISSDWRPLAFESSVFYLTMPTGKKAACTFGQCARWTHPSLVQRDLDEIARGAPDCKEKNEMDNDEDDMNLYDSLLKPSRANPEHRCAYYDIWQKAVEIQTEKSSRLFAFEILHWANLGRVRGNYFLVVGVPGSGKSAFATEPLKLILGKKNFDMASGCGSYGLLDILDRNIKAFCVDEVVLSRWASLLGTGTGSGGWFKRLLNFLTTRQIEVPVPRNCTRDDALWDNPAPCFGSTTEELFLAMGEDTEFKTEKRVVLENEQLRQRCKYRLWNVDLTKKLPSQFGPKAQAKNLWDICAICFSHHLKDAHDHYDVLLDQHLQCLEVQEGEAEESVDEFAVDISPDECTDHEPEQVLEQAADEILGSISVPFSAFDDVEGMAF
ncbi:unnamed protein product [Amoebophrya sp. A25]|nr:unnamed protein product [Amoebophrya sp. A25]|eukprot:GSA25T00005169001.1